MPAASVTIASGATWEEVAADRQEHRDRTIALIEPSLPEITEIPTNTISVAHKILSKEEIDITQSLVEELIPKLANGALTSFEVVKAFMRRSGLAQKLVSLLISYSTNFDSRSYRQIVSPKFSTRELSSVQLT